MTTPVSSQQVYPTIEPTAPTLPTLHSHDKEISQIKKEGLFTRFANAIKSIFNGKVREVRNNIIEAKKIEGHKTKITTTALERIDDHKNILKCLKKAEECLKKAEEKVRNQDLWKIDLKIAQELYAGGELNDALIHLIKIPPEKRTKEMTYFKAVVLKKMDKFLEAKQLYEELIEAKRPPGKMTKEELKEELNELEEMWFDKAISEEDIRIVNDVLPREKKVEVPAGVAPHVKGEKLDYFDMSRIPEAKFDQTTLAFKYLKKNIKNGDNTEIIRKALWLSDSSEKWKWYVRLAKEYDFMARKPGLTEKERTAHLEMALSQINCLENDSYLLRLLAIQPQISFIKASLLLKTGKLDLAAEEFKKIKTDVDPNTSLGQEVAAESITKLIEESDQRITQKKIEGEKRIEEEKQKNQKLLIENFEKKWIGEFFKQDMNSDYKRFNEFLKNHGRTLKILNLQEGLKESYREWDNKLGYVTKERFSVTFDTATIIGWCPNVAGIRLLDAKSANALIKLIGQGKVPHLDSLGLSQCSDIEKVDLALLAENLICTPDFSGVDLSGISNASKFIENVEQESGIERLVLSKCQLTPEAYASIPVKFTNLKTLDLSDVKEFKDIGEFINHLNNPSEIDNLNLSNKKSWDRQTLLTLGDKLVNLPKLKSLKLEFVEESNFGVKTIHENLNELFAKLINGLNEGSQLETVNIRIGDYTLTPDNVLGKAMRKILSENLARIPQIKTLAVNGYDWGPVIAEMRKAQQAEVQQVEAPVVEQLNANKPVKELLKEQNMTWTQFLELVKHHQHEIKSLNFNQFSHSYELSWATKNELYELMTSLPNLVQISARDCFDVTDIVLELIAEGKLKQVEIVDLSKNELTNSDAIALANSSDRLPKLKKLILSENLIHDEGAKALAEKLKALADFEELDIKLNIYGKEGQQALQDILEEIPTVEISKEEIEPGAIENPIGPDQPEEEGLPNTMETETAEGSS